MNSQDVQGPLCENMTSSTKPEVHNIAEDDIAMATVDMHNNVGEIWPCGV